jgi:predicted metal-dependent enzyme (double-stranded beta helix superfamily)
MFIVTMSIAGGCCVERDQLNAFVGGVRHEIALGNSQEDTARSVRRLVREYLSSGPFLLDCIEGALDTMNGPLGSAWTNPPLGEDDELAFSIRLFFWPPGFANQPHRHDDWTVTGVFHNTLTFWTYGEAPQGLVVERRIEAFAADAGYISSPCIHNVSNESKQISVSLHVFSGAKTQTGGRGRSQWYGEAPAKSTQGDRLRALRAFVEAAARVDDPRRSAVLDRLFGLGDSSIKLAAAKAIARLDPALGAERLDELAALCSDGVAAELHRLSKRLRAAAEVSREPSSARGAASEAESAGRWTAGGPLR